jgi:DNA polymerase-3 subunit epsilon
LEIFNQDIRDLEFVAFDLETTGLFPITSAIIEIGAVKFNLNGEISRYQALVNPEIPITQSSFLIHGITEDMVEGKPTIEKVLPDFLDFIKDTVLIAHNATFDVSFISYSLVQHGFEIPKNLVLDTRTLAKSLVDAPDFKLGTLTKFFDIPFTTFHRAVNDAEYCKNVFINLMEILSRERSINMDIISIYNKPIQFNIISKDKNNSLELPEMYRPLREAIHESSVVKISYKRFNGEITSREITPINFLKLKNKLYLEAFCHLRGERRTFKLSKILNMSI